MNYAVEALQFDNLTRMQIGSVLSRSAPWAGSSGRRIMPTISPLTPLWENSDVSPSFLLSHNTMRFQYASLFHHLPPIESFAMQTKIGNVYRFIYWRTRQFTYPRPTQDERYHNKAIECLIESQKCCGFKWSTAFRRFTSLWISVSGSNTVGLRKGHTFDEQVASVAGSCGCC